MVASCRDLGVWRAYPFIMIRPLAAVLTLLVAAALIAASAVSSTPTPGAASEAGPGVAGDEAGSGEVLRPGAWRRDAGWNQGKAEWALYESSRVIYGVPRSYETTIFTNRQHMDPESWVKASDWRAPGVVPVFKHNISAIIPTENYDYRFLTTCFGHAGSSRLFKVVMSSQEDCGSTYKEFRFDGRMVLTSQRCYFPGDADVDRVLNTSPDLQIHDALSLTLRDYPFDAPEPLELVLMESVTDTHRSDVSPSRAQVTYVGVEELTLPYGVVAAHHLRVEHAAVGGVESTDLWFAASASDRHVMVQYEGPWGVRMRLKRLDWWAYWSDPRPE